MDALVLERLSRWCWRRCGRGGRSVVPSCAAEWRFADVGDVTEGSVAAGHRLVGSEPSPMTVMVCRSRRRRMYRLSSGSMSS